jgi:hypothetical protein
LLLPLLPLLPPGFASCCVAAARREEELNAAAADLESEVSNASNALCCIIMGQSILHGLLWGHSLLGQMMLLKGGCLQFIMCMTSRHDE